MKHTLESFAEEDFICLSWKKPKYTPIGITVRYQCSLLCERQFYLKQQSDVPVDHTQFTITKLKPGTICKMHLLVTYNPSGLDRGNYYEFKTLQAGELQKHVHKKT